ncbi:MAG: GNAT family N-acetyltransferase [Clostridia bacterium]|nr:GNAT family N-acetyltransferase [Clostridia bacterium]
MVEQHFGLTGPEICKVDKDTPLARQLIEFVEHFSWEEVKEHTLQNLNNWVFTDWETLFVARIDGKIVGMASLFKTDYYPLPEIYPWVSSLFVTEAYRGQRISQKLVDYANDYAKSLGFERTYIPSEHVGLYEKYGYTYLKDIVNYGGGVDRLYVKELKE